MRLIAFTLPLVLWGVSGLLSREAPMPTADGPAVKILAPPSPTKLRVGRTVPIRIEVRARTYPISEWVLVLEAAASDTVELARGSTAVAEGVVARLTAESLRAGIEYTLRLSARDIFGGESTTDAAVLVPDPLYSLIPVEAGNFSRRTQYGLSLDESGTLIAFGGENYGDIRMFDVPTSSLTQFHVPLAASEGQKLTADGRRYLFRQLSKLGFYDLRSQMLLDGPSATSAFFSADRTGRLIAFQSNFDLDPSVGNPDRTLQYFLYDDETKAVRQLTNDPNAIIYNSNYPFCPGIIGTTPMISGDGSTVVFMTSVPLGLAPADPAVGCHVFAYDVASRSLRHVTATPKGVVLNHPSLSYDGRWLGVTSTRPAAFTQRGTFPALLDVQTGELTDPVGDVNDWVGFDSVITGDGGTIVVSNQADLDPRVGNADHRPESESSRARCEPRRRSRARSWRS
jgi:hypothetical protein